MARARIWRPCFDALQRLPRWVQKEAITLCRTIPSNPDLGLPLEPPLQDFFSVHIRTDYRLLYTYHFESDTWWVVWAGKRKPGKKTDVYDVFKRIVEAGIKFK